jgi:CHAT domain-containing protein/tetratricopeptide (TPR) repeat protein
MATTLCVHGLLLAALVACAGSALAGAQPAPESRATSDAGTAAHADALLLLERAAEEARRTHDQEALGQALVGLAGALHRVARYTDARAHAEEALALATAGGDVRLEARTALLLSAIEDIAGNAQAGRAHAERARTRFEDLGDIGGALQARLRIVRLQSPDGTEDPQELGEIASAAAALGDADLEGRTLHHLGDRLFTLGRYAEALPALMRAASFFEPERDAVVLGTIYNSTGRVYRAHGRIEDALQWQQRALALHEQAGDALALMQSLNAVSAMYQRLGRIADARRHSERALALAERTGSDRVEDFLRASLAMLLAEDGELERAVGMLEQVVERGRDTQLATRYGQLSALYSRLHRSQDALEAAQRGLELCGETKDVCLNALANRAGAHEALGNAEAALADVNNALSQLEELRAGSLSADYFRQTFQLAHERLYSAAISLQAGRGDAARALETAERFRGRALLDLLATRALTLPATSGVTVASGHAVPTLPPVVWRGSTPPPAPPLPATSAGQRQAQVPPASVEALTATAARLGSTLLAYWVGERATFVWVLGADGTVAVRKVDVLQTRLASLVRATAPFETSPAATGRGAARPSITTRGKADVDLQASRTSAWRELYGLLIEPVRALLPAGSGALLTIVPHGSLQHLSFAALQSARGRYLIEDYTLHYAPAGALLEYTRLRQRHDARTQPLLLVADPALRTRSALDRPLPRLPGARQEARAIARLLPAAQAQTLQGSAATEHDVRQRMRGPAVLHFATHAIVRDDDPFASYLALTGTTDEEDGDGLLTAQDLYGLALHADMVVLSACRSAGGTVTGDGVSTFARAFLYAGTATVVASQWDVADEPTNRLLPAFYRAWLTGAPKAEALRRAQLTLLRDLRNGRVRIQTPVGVVALPEHPVFWAGFAVFGEPN